MRKNKGDICESNYVLPQRLQAEIITGHQLLQVLLCDAVSSMEKETGAKRYISKLWIKV